MPDFSGKSPTPAPISVSTPVSSASGSYQANDVSSSSSDQEKNIEMVSKESAPKMPNFDRILDNIYYVKEA